MSSENRVSNPSGGALSRVDTGKLQIGVVKVVGDSEVSGRLKVWIKGSSSLETDPTGWITCAYASPFAGATDPAVLGGALQSFNDTQTSYGIWAVPPDTGNEVIVCFINGDIRKAYWIACLYQKDMNYMVPGIAEGSSFQSKEFGGNALPVAEYNKLGNSADQRPYYQPLTQGLSNQGLLGDDLRGAGNSTSRRESPSAVQGWLTPGGNQFVMDDGNGSELIRLRTKSGVQLLLSETFGHVYAITRDGKSWIELNNDGNVDIYAGANFNVHAVSDINLKAGGTINAEAGIDININAQKNINNQAKIDINLNSSNNTNVTANKNYNLVSKGDTSVTTHGTTINAQYGNTRTWRKAGGYIAYYDTLSHPATPVIQNSAPHEEIAKIPQPHQVSLKNNKGQEAPANSICGRIPDHEPWSLHAESVVGTREKVELGTSTASQGSIVEKPTAPLTVIGSPTPGMTPGVYLPKGYDKKDQPIYEFSGTTSALTDVNQLVTSPEGIAFIERQEGRSLVKYKDANGFSIGYGHFIVPSDSAEVKSGVISQETAEALLRNDLKKSEAAVRKNITAKLTQSQFDALVDFVYNVGAGALAKSTLRKKLNAGDYSSVPTELSKWTKSQGKVLPVLVKRRREEALLFSRPAQTSQTQ